MKRFLPSYFIVLSFVMTMSQRVEGQSRWGIDCRPALNVPTRLFSGIKLEPGFGFDGHVTYNVVGIASVYYGWGWSMFPLNKTDGQALSVQRMGSSFGMKLSKPINRYYLGYFIKGGAIHQQVNVENTTQKRYHSGKHWGWQIESGLSLPLDHNIALQPGLKYMQLNGNISENGSPQGFHLNDLSAGIILAITFGRKN
jgi:hypothetical protein